MDRNTGYGIMMRMLNSKTAYAVALALAAVSGSVLANAGTARAAAPAKANAVTLSSEAMVERTTLSADGKENVALKSPKDVIVVPGDRVVFTLKYANQSTEPAAGFRATNPMPGPVQFIAVAEDWAEVSVDGGVTWGKLTQLTVKSAPTDGAAPVERAATPADVTHVRWVFAEPIAPGAKGSVSYRGIVK
jgi:hypothetical protein